MRSKERKERDLMLLFCASHHLNENGLCNHHLMVNTATKRGEKLW